MKGINLELLGQIVGSGPSDFKAQYRIGNSGTWTDLIIIKALTDWVSGSVSNLTLPVVCENQANVQIRWLLTSNTAVNNTPILSTGNGRIDEITVVGDVLPPCSIMSSIANGLWSDPNIWSCGRVPDINDMVIIGHNVAVSGTGFCKNISYTGLGKIDLILGGNLKINTP